MSPPTGTTWYSSLLAALEAARYTHEEVVASVVAEVGEDPDWLKAALSGDVAPSASEYLILSAVTSIPVPVLAGLVDPAASTGVALRAGTLAAPGEATEAAQRRGIELVGTSRLICSWLGADWAERASRLERARNMISHEAFSPNAGKFAAQQVRAMLARMKLISRDGPIGDLVSLVESLGIPVEFREDLPEGIHGLTIHDQSLGTWDCAILIRVQDFWVRQRYTLAHELCHVLYRDSGLVFVNDEKVPESAKGEEVRAEAFARHFLAPSLEARAIWSSHLKGSGGDVNKALCEFMLHFGISRQASIRLLVEERLAKRALLQEIAQSPVWSCMQSAGLGTIWDELVEEQGKASASVWLVESALHLYEEGLVPASVVASALGQPEDNVRRDLELQGWQVRADL
ncbi:MULTISPECIES: ImmA/IrrE family metallo-endopeptidase [unclassified Micromonospora]|uniref:ImmA/IrrE family metallo-endopeptidase n=1 Tax=unclassified Micromonospora TaxID=2617518 RepID=UPI00331A3A22